MVRRWLFVAAVGVVGLLLGAIIAGRPQSVPSDLVSSEIEIPSTTALATTAASVEPVQSTESLVPEALVRVVVGNATNVPAVVTLTADRIRQFGYSEVVLADAVMRRAESVIFFANGRQEEAQRLAEQLGVDSALVQMRLNGELTMNGETGDVWVLVGTDSL